MSNQQLANEIRKALDAKYWTLEQANQVPTWLRSLLEENSELQTQVEHWHKKWAEDKDALNKAWEELQQLREELEQVRVDSEARYQFDKERAIRLESELEQVKKERDAFRQELLFGSRTSARSTLEQYARSAIGTTAQPNEVEAD